MTQDSLASLERAVRGSVVRAAETLDRLGRDASHLVGKPVAAAAPADADDVVALVQWARRERVPLVVRGGGTSLEGGSVPSARSVVVDLSGWNSILEVREEELWARVGPGTVNLDLQRALRPRGLFFPPNPGSWTRSTIGGNVGTNASGPRSFAYGPTRAWVRAVEVVLGNGRRLRLGSLALKRSVGPDLLSLVVGSEGTLGIVTEVTVRLAPIAPTCEGLVVPLPDNARLGEVASRLARAHGTGLSAVEYVDRTCAAALAERRRSLGPTGQALLLLEIEADGPMQAAERRELVRELLSTVGVNGAAVAVNPEELWTLRGQAGTSLNEQVGPSVREDVAVPLGRLDELVDALRAIGRESGARFFLYGHLGEGSLHPNFAVDPASPAAERVRGKVVRAALALGGTISAEHGIGVLKIPYLAEEVGSDAVDWMLAVKRWCDPDGILNPGKIYPPP